MHSKLCLTQKELARRWVISHRTLERWRWTGEGPDYLKLGGRVIYRLEDIMTFEAAALRRGDASQSAQVS
jgi:predicted site-specific integrase-resolvase